MKHALLTALLAAAALLAACGERDSSPQSAPPRLDNGRIVFAPGSAQLGAFVTEPVAAAGPQRLRLTGRLVWDEGRSVRLYPAFGGRVTRILVKPGDPVKPGQALAVLASPDFGQAQADARRAESDFALAEKNLARVRELHAAGVVARKDLAAAEADHARAQAEFARAGARVKLYGASGGTVDQNLTLSSPIAGVVVERNINPGQELRPDLQLANSPPLFVVTDPAHLWVQLDATEGQLAGLRRGQAMRLRSAAWPEETFEATLDAISDFIDPATRMVKIRGSLENRERRLKGEMFVTAELEGGVRAPLRVAERALVLSGGKYYVFVEEAPGRYARAEVSVEGVHDGAAGVLAGVSLGQKVVVEGNLFLDRLQRQLTGGAG